MDELKEKQYELEFKKTKLRIERDSALLELEKVKEKLHAVTLNYLDADRERVLLRQKIEKALVDMRAVHHQLEVLAELNGSALAGGVSK